MARADSSAQHLEQRAVARRPNLRERLVVGSEHDVCGGRGIARERHDPRVDATVARLPDENTRWCRAREQSDPRTLVERGEQVDCAEVVKAFNTLFAQVLAEGADFGIGQKATVFVASDSTRGKQITSTLAQSMGFAVVDAGGLKNARYLEPLAGLNIYLGYGAGLGTAIAPTWIRKA